MSQVEQVRQTAYERYLSSRRFEEKTDIAERLGYPIDTTITYRMKDGVAHALTDTKDRPFHQQTAEAYRRGRVGFTGSQAFEVTRLQHEHSEALLVDALGRGELEGNVLLKFSKVPDAVTSGVTDIKGYRRDLLRSFVRMYYREDDYIHCRLFTLDHNNPEGIAAVGELLSINTTQQSEAVLAASTIVETDNPRGFVDGLVDAVREKYDEVVHLSTGKHTYAGSWLLDHHNAMQVIEQQSGLFEEYMRVLTSIEERSLHTEDKERIVEAEREKIAAAIKLSASGVAVSSMGDAVVADEVDRGEYGRECATAPNGMSQAQVENIWRQGECQVCFRKTSVGSCAVCRDCQAADDRGVDLLKEREKNLRSRTRAKRTGSAALSRTVASSSVKPSKAQRAKVAYGEHAAVRFVIGIGGSRHDVVDVRTDQVLGSI